MFVNGYFLGVSFISNPITPFEKTTYDRVELFGGQAIYDKLWIRNIEEDDDYYESITNVEDYQPTFDSDTVFLAEFENNLKAGNVDTGGDPIESFIVTKRKIGSSINTSVGEFDVNTTSVIDYRVQKGSNYVYQVTPKTADALGSPFVSETVESDYYGIFLIDEDTGLSINFDINGEIGTTNALDDQTVYNTFNRYNTISIGNRNALVGTISGIVPETLTYCTDGFIQSSDFIDTVQDFVNNGNAKLLKTRKGDIYKVITRNFRKSQLENKIQEQISVVSFDFEEIEDVTEYK